MVLNTDDDGADWRWYYVVQKLRYNGLPPTPKVHVSISKLLPFRYKFNFCYKTDL